jgi:hypothetical protein
VLSDLLTDEDQKAGFCLVLSDLIAVQKMSM